MPIKRPSEYPPDYYSFQQYNSKQRMLTYWYQIHEVLALRPATVLEIGVGTGLVSSYLRHLGISLTTYDINPELKPDIVGSVLDLASVLGDQKFDLVLCARVLHHLSYEEFPAALAAIAAVSNRNAVVTLPMEDFRLYLMARYTSSSLHTVSLPLPLMLKRKFFEWLKVYDRDTKFRSGQWKINSTRNINLKNIQTQVSQKWKIEKNYRIPEDSAHYMLALTKK